MLISEMLIQATAVMRRKEKAKTEAAYQDHICEVDVCQK